MQRQFYHMFCQFVTIFPGSDISFLTAGELGQFSCCDISSTLLEATPKQSD